MALSVLSPVLRLQEARRLMLGEDLDATTAGYRVGYDDASHFNREYKREFGEPPMRDVARRGTSSSKRPPSEQGATLSRLGAHPNCPALDPADCSPLAIAPGRRS